MKLGLNVVGTRSEAYRFGLVTIPRSTHSGGVQPSDGQGPYAAAKASVIALTATTALE
jgi:hypothetical protein